MPPLLAAALPALISGAMSMGASALAPDAPVPTRTQSGQTPNSGLNFQIPNLTATQNIPAMMGRLSAAMAGGGQPSMRQPKGKGQPMGQGTQGLDIGQLLAALYKSQGGVQ